MSCSVNAITPSAPTSSSHMLTQQNGVQSAMMMHACAASAIANIVGVITAVSSQRDGEACANTMD